MFVNFTKAGNGSPVLIHINADKIRSINLSADGTRGSVTTQTSAVDVFIQDSTIETLKALGFVQVGTKLINSSEIEHITQTEKRVSLPDGTELNKEQLALFLAAADNVTPALRVSRGILNNFKTSAESSKSENYILPYPVKNVERYKEAVQNPDELLREDLLQPKIPTRIITNDTVLATDDTQVEYIWDNGTTEATTEEKPKVKRTRKQKE